MHSRYIIFGFLTSKRLSTLYQCQFFMYVWHSYLHLKDSRYSCNATSYVAYASSWPIALSIIFFCCTVTPTRINQFSLQDQIIIIFFFPHRLINGRLHGRLPDCFCWLFLFLASLSNKWKAFFRSDFASLRSFQGGDLDDSLVIRFCSITSQPALWGHITVPFLQCGVWKISVNLRFIRLEAGKGALCGRELLTRLPYSTYLIQMASEEWWLVTAQKFQWIRYPFQLRMETVSRIWYFWGGGCNVLHRCLFSDFHLSKFSTI